MRKISVLLALILFAAVVPSAAAQPPRPEEQLSQGIIFFGLERGWPVQDNGIRMDLQILNGPEGIADDCWLEGVPCDYWIYTEVYSSYSGTFPTSTKVGVVFDLATPCWRWFWSWWDNATGQGDSEIGQCLNIKSYPVAFAIYRPDSGQTLNYWANGQVIHSVSGSNFWPVSDASYKFYSSHPPGPNFNGYWDPIRIRGYYRTGTQYLGWNAITSYSEPIALCWNDYDPTYGYRYMASWDNEFHIVGPKPQSFMILPCKFP